MQIGRESHSYKTRDNAVKQLTKALAELGYTLDNARWVIVAQDDGRFSPAVVLGNGTIPMTMALALVHRHVLVIG